MPQRSVKGSCFHSDDCSSPEVGGSGNGDKGQTKEKTNKFGNKKNESKTLYLTLSPEQSEYRTNFLWKLETLPEPNMETHGKQGRDM